MEFLLIWYWLVWRGVALRSFLALMGNTARENWVCLDGNVWERSYRGAYPCWYWKDLYHRHWLPLYTDQLNGSNNDHLTCFHALPCLSDDSVDMQEHMHGLYHD